MSGGPVLGRVLMLTGLILLPACDLVSGEGEGGSGGKATTTKAVGPREKTARKSALDEAIAAQENYVYNPIGKRDPFRSFLTVGEGGSVDDTPRTPLQRYELDQYQLVGIIWGIDRPRALVQDPDMIGHVMEIGTYIGKNWGKVTQITSSEVVVTEEFQNIDGELIVNNISMALPFVGDGSNR